MSIQFREILQNLEELTALITDVVELTQQRSYSLESYQEQIDLLIESIKGVLTQRNQEIAEPQLTSTAEAKIKANLELLSEEEFAIRYNATVDYLREASLDSCLSMLNSAANKSSGKTLTLIQEKIHTIEGLQTPSVEGHQDEYEPRTAHDEQSQSGVKRILTSPETTQTASSEFSQEQKEKEEYGNAILSLEELDKLIDRILSKPTDSLEIHQEPIKVETSTEAKSQQTTEKSSKTKKVQRKRTPIIEDAPGAVLPLDGVFLLNELRQKIQAEIKRHEQFLLFDLSTYKKLASYDSDLKQLIRQFVEIDVKLNEIQKKLTPYLTASQTLPKSKEIFEESLCQLTALNDSKQKLKNEIVSRIVEKQLLIPEHLSVEELNQELSREKALLKTALKNCFLTLVAMDPSNNRLENALDREIISQFIEELFTGLQQMGSLTNLETLSDFRQKLVLHLEAAKDQQDVSDSRLDATKIDIFLESIFTQTTSLAVSQSVQKTQQTKFIQNSINAFAQGAEDSAMFTGLGIPLLIPIASTINYLNNETVSKPKSEAELTSEFFQDQIVKTRILLNKINEFKLDRIQKMQNNNAEIEVRYLNLNERSNYLAHALKAQLDLIPFAMEERLEGFRIHENLRQLNENLNALHAEFKAEYANFFTPTSSSNIGFNIGQFIELMKSNNLFSKNPAKVAEFFDKIEQIIALQEELKEQLVLIEENLQKEDAPSVLQIKKLNENYNLAKNQIIATLVNDLADAKSVLEDFYGERVAAQALFPFQTDFQRLVHSETNIYNLELIINKQRKRLTDFVDNHLARINQKYNAKIQALSEKQTQLPYFSRNNPFKQIWSNENLNLKGNIEIALSIHRELATSEKGQLKTILARLDNAIKTAEDKQKTCDAILQNAYLIENRLNSQVYRQSKRAILEIDKECRVIAGKKARKLATITAENINIYRKNLDQIDLRLFKLLEMKFRFEGLNENYINTDLELITPVDKRVKPNLVLGGYIDEVEKVQLADNSYKASLLDIVTTTIYSPDMEHLSDGALFGLIQFIRIHILKPLFYSNSNEEKVNKSNRHGFFVPPVKLTMWASETEKSMFKLGEDIAHTIAAPAA